MALKKIRMEAARTDDFPEGSPNHGYEFVVPLQSDGHIDFEAWKSDPLICTMVRFWGSEEDEHGQLVRTADGGWAFSYVLGEEDDEAIYHLEQHIFAEGEYVSVRERDGVTRTFRVVAVNDWHPGR
jgi:hypothetical protein